MQGGTALLDLDTFKTAKKHCVQNKMPTTNGHVIG